MKDSTEELKKIKNNYKLKVGDIVVEMIYSDNNKKFNECIINILKQKLNT